MANYLRITICILLIFLMIIGGIFYYLKGTGTSSAAVSQQNTVCQSSIATVLVPRQSLQFNCYVTENNWLDLSLKVVGNTSVNAVVYYNQTSLKVLAVVYNSTGTKLNPSIPLVATGPLLINITNVGRANAALTGNYAIYSRNQSSIQFYSTIYPFRILGLGVAGVAAVLLFVILWDPYRISSRVFRF